MRILSYTAIHQGGREYQQDFMSDSGECAAGRLWVLCDGMGGMANGDKFAKAGCDSAVNTFGSIVPQEGQAMHQVLLKCFAAAQRETLKIQDSAHPGGSTMLLVYISSNMCSYLSIGDSRIYLLRDGGLIQLTREQEYGYVLDFRAVTGEINAEVARTSTKRAALTNHLAKEKPLPCDLCSVPFRLKPGDRIFEMSDGVFGTLNDEEIQELANGPAEAVARSIIDATIAKRKPHQDNCSVQMIAVEE